LPVSYVIERDSRLVVTTGVGHVTFEEVKRHQDLLLADPGFDPRFNQLIDATAMTQFDVSADEARQIAERRIFSPASRRAFLASKPSVFGIGRLMQVYQDRFRCSLIANRPSHGWESTKRS
jgi:hypothetical protein